jgi:hypothetical protein
MAASAASLVRATTSVARMFPAAPGATEARPPGAPVQPAHAATAQPAAAKLPRAGGQPATAQPATEQPAAAQPAAAARPPAFRRPATSQPSARPRTAAQKPRPARRGKPGLAIRSPTGTPPPPTAGGSAGPARRPARRWQLAGLIIAVVVLAGALAAVTMLKRPAASHGTGSTAGPGSSLLAGETAIRGQAVAWITAQVDHTAALACDAAVCSDLAQHGFPAANLNVIPATAPDPYGSQLLIASADVRSQFARRLTFYAPMLIASFGTGVARIDVRVIAANGAAYQGAFRQDLRARRNSGAELAGNKLVALTPAARVQLLAGDVDLRLVTALAFVVANHKEPISIVSFGGFGPGAAPGVPLRWAYLAESDPAARQRGAGYLTALLSYVRNLRPPYAPLNLSTVSLPPGRNVLRIEFAAPSPLNMLPS